jgi:hypothetical protein
MKIRSASKDLLLKIEMDSLNEFARTIDLTGSEEMDKYSQKIT